MWSRLLWSVVPQALGWTKNYQTCATAYDKATGKFTVFPAHGFSGGEYLVYDKSTAPAITGMADKQLVKVVKVDDKVFTIERVNAKLVGAAVATIAEDAVAGLSVASWQPVTRVAAATSMGAAVAHGTDKDFLKFTQASKAVCSQDGDQLELVMTGTTSVVVTGTAPDVVSPAGNVKSGGGAQAYAPNINFYCQTTSAFNILPADTTTAFTSNTEFILYPTGTSAAIATANTGQVAHPSAATPVALTSVDTQPLVFINWNGKLTTKKTKYPMCGSPADTDASCAYLNGDGTKTTDKPIWDTTNTKCVEGTTKNCAANKKGDVWDATGKKCKAGSTSSAARALVSTAIVAIFGLMA